MIQQTKTAVLLLLTTLSLIACKSNYASVKYLNNYEIAMTEKMNQSSQDKSATIMPKDLLQITVSGITDEDFASQFNLNENVVLEGNRIRSTRYYGGQLHEYLVDNAGNIQFPVFGAIHIAGKTIEHAQTQIADSIRTYLAANEHPIVRITFQNYKFTILGEVNRPGMYSMTREDITIFDAIARAGDMTIYGKRNKVKLIREDITGRKALVELDLTDSRILTSPYYYLQQNDIIYVEPNKVKSQNSKVGSMTTTWVSFAAVVVSVGSLLYNILK